MDDSIEGGKELLSETVHAFKAGLHGEEYVPGRFNPQAEEMMDELGKLNDLRDSGTLSPEEYAAARERLLGNP